MQFAGPQLQKADKIRKINIENFAGRASEPNAGAAYLIV
jgi:hypothetical protein